MMSVSDSPREIPFVEPQTQQFVFHHAKRAVQWALFFNIATACIKLGIAVWVTRSAALMSEGLHSLGDAMNSLTLLIGIRRGTRAPDRSHPFGYGLETNFWALLAAMVLFFSSVFSVWTGWDRLQHPEGSIEIFWGVIILLVSVVLEVFAIRTASQAVLQEVGMDISGNMAQFVAAFKNVRNVTSPTTRFVFYEDTLALLGALIALIALLLTRFGVQWGWLNPGTEHIPDSIASMLIGTMLMVLAISLLRYNRSFLIGSAAPVHIENKIQTLVEADPDISMVSDIKTIDQGLSGLIVHLKVQVEADTLVKDVDDLMERIKIRLQKRFPNIRQVFIEVLADEREDEWEDKFEGLIQQGQIQGILQAREVAMLQNVFDFSKAVVRDVMIPRTDVEYVDIETPLTEVADLMIETSHSRLPVFQEHVDNVVGVITARDVYQAIRQNDLTRSLADLTREIDIYPENKKVSDLLEDFKRKKIQMAVVADEHGGFSGVVTIEDLMEEIVGDIWDEHDVEELSFSLNETKTTATVSGKYDIEELNDSLGITIPTDEFKTLGGFVFGQLGREPEAGDEVTLGELTFLVTEVDGARIKTVQIISPVAFQPVSAPLE